MKKILFFLVFVVALIMSACEPGRSKIDEISTSLDNLQCSFVLDSPVGYDFVYGVGFSGVVYENSGTTARTLWVPKAIYEKITSNKDSQAPKIYKGKCFYCRGYSRPFLSPFAYFVYYVE